MIRVAGRFFTRLALLVLAFGLSGSAVRAAEKAEISVERMKKDIFFLASEECEGRGVETQGINRAADYIAVTFKDLGLKPTMPDGSFFQPFSITGTSKLSSPNSFVLSGQLAQEVAPKINSQWAV